MVALLVTLQFNSHFTGQLTGHFYISVVTDADNVKDVLEVLGLMVTQWKGAHPSNTEDEVNMGLTSEDEAEGLGPQTGVAWRGQVARGGPPWGATPTPVGEGEVVVKRQALRRMKQQVSALLRGKDLPEGAEAHKAAEVSYQLPAVERDAMVCPVCERELPNHHKLMKYMGVHHGEKFPCSKCGKVLALRL